MARVVLTKLAFAALLLVAVSACTSETKPKADVSFGLSNLPRTLDVRHATDASSFRILQLLYQAPVRFNDRYEAIPWLCTWQKLTHKHFRFSIKGQPKFESGAPLTSHDIKATYESVLDKKTASPHRGSLSHIERIVIVDDTTVDFHLSRSDPLFPSVLTIGVLPQSWIKQPVDQPSVNGAFRFLSPWDGDGDIWLENRDNGTVLRFIESRDPTTRALKLLKGEVDVLQNNLPPELIQWLSKREDLEVRTKAGSTFSYLGFNLNDPVTSQFDVRRAIAHAIDRKQLIQFIFAQGARTSESILTPEHWAGTQLASYAYDPKKAQALLANLGYSSTNPLSIVYKTSKNPFRLRLATVIQDQLKKSYINLEIRSFDWGTFYSDIKAGRFQLFSLSWVGIKGTDIFRYVFHSDSMPPKGANRGRYQSAAVDALIEAAESTEDIVERKRLLAELQQIIHDELPYVPLWYENNTAIVSDRITGFELSSDGNFLSLAHTRKRIE